MSAAGFRTRHAFGVVMMLGLLSVATACGGGAIKPMPTPAIPRPVPVPVVPTVIEPVATSWTMPAVVPSTRYVSEVRATLERDSAGRVLTEQVETRGVITLLGRRDALGAFRGSGTVDSFTIRGLESAVVSPPGEPRNTTPVPVLPEPVLRVNFDAALDTRILRVAPRPALPNECDRPETAATGLVRDLIVRLPKTLVVGATWRDSTVSFLCRLSVPITTRSMSTYTVERAEQVQNRVELLVRKVSDTQLAGELKSTWRTLSVDATGRSTQTIRVDATTGLVRTIDSDGMLTIKLTDTSRRDGSGAQEIRQKTRGQVTLRP